MVHDSTTLNMMACPVTLIFKAKIKKVEDYNIASNTDYFKYFIPGANDKQTLKQNPIYGISG